MLFPSALPWFGSPSWARSSSAFGHELIDSCTVTVCSSICFWRLSISSLGGASKHNNTSRLVWNCWRAAHRAVRVVLTWAAADSCAGCWGAPCSRRRMVSVVRPTKRRALGSPGSSLVLLGWTGFRRPSVQPAAPKKEQDKCHHSCTWESAQLRDGHSRSQPDGNQVQVKHNRDFFSKDSVD